MLNWNFLFQLCIVLLPIVSIFLTGLKFPVENQIIKPVFQPPSWAFSLVWTYITIALGLITNIFYTSAAMCQRFVIILFFITLLALLNSWLVFNYNKSYKVSFYVLVASCFVSIMYICYLCFISNGIKNSFLVFFLLPLPFWLCVASCLNGVIYQEAYNKRLV